MRKARQSDTRGGKIDPAGPKAPSWLGADTQSVDRASLLSVVLLSWLGIALTVGTIVGHGIAFGTGSASE